MGHMVVFFFRCLDKQQFSHSSLLLLRQFGGGERCEALALYLFPVVERWFWMHGGKSYNGVITFLIGEQKYHHTFCFVCLQLSMGTLFFCPVAVCNGYQDW